MRDGAKWAAAPAALAAEAYGAYTGNQAIRPSTYVSQVGKGLMSVAEKGLGGLAAEALDGQETVKQRQRCDGEYAAPDDRKTCYIQRAGYKAYKGAGGELRVEPSVDCGERTKWCEQTFGNTKSIDPRWIMYTNNPNDPKTWRNDLNNCVKENCQQLDLRQTARIRVDGKRYLTEGVDD